MKKTGILEKRFIELLRLGNAVLVTRRPPPPNVAGDFRVDSQQSQQWATSTAQLLRSIFGEQSEYYKRFEQSFRIPGYYSDMEHGMAVLSAAWNDYSKGYLTEAVDLIRAEVFDDFLEQARYLFDQGYYHPAAVLAGCVLEDSLRKLCTKNNIQLSATPKLDGMNSELAKKGVYGVLVQKRITWLADIRNKAAHGQWSEFTSNDVATMLQQVRDFITDYST